MLIDITLSDTFRSRQFGEMLNKLIQLTLLGLLVNAELLQVKNNAKDDLLVSVTGREDFLVPPEQIVSITTVYQSNFRQFRTVKKVVCSTVYLRDTH